MEHFTLKDARDFIDTQLDRDAKIDHLAIDEYKWFIAQLIQLEQAEALKRIATQLEHGQVALLQGDDIVKQLARIATGTEMLESTR